MLTFPLSLSSRMDFYLFNVSQSFTFCGAHIVLKFDSCPLDMYPLIFEHSLLSCTLFASDLELIVSPRSNSYICGLRMGYGNQDRSKQTSLLIMSECKTLIISFLDPQAVVS